jgi:integrase
VDGPVLGQGSREWAEPTQASLRQDRAGGQRPSDRSPEGPPEGLAEREAGAGPSLEQYAGRWLAACEGRIRPRSIYRYRDLLESHVLPRLGKVQIGQLEPRQVNAVMLEARNRGLSVRTCNYIRVTLRAMLSEAERDGLVGRNVAALVRPFADQREERPLSVLSPGQARILLEAAKEDREGPLWVLAITTGLRQGELAGLRWEDVDLEVRQLQVRRTLQYQNGLGWLEQKPKTARSRRTLALPEVAVVALQRQQSRQAEERLAAGEAWC